MRHLLERFPGADSALIVPGGAALFGLQPDCRLLCDVRKSEKLLTKARAFLREHQDHTTVVKIRTSTPLTQTDLIELEHLLAKSGVGSTEEIERAKAESHGLGLFIRSLVGLDREAAKKALGGFLSGKAMSANQIEFVNLIINQLTEHGIMDATLLYESPFTDVAPQGPEALFTPQQVDELVAILREVHSTAMAA
jgi:type I restriction enzyme R subunit